MSKNITTLCLVFAIMELLENT